VVPAGANGMTMRTGFVGHPPCARSDGDANAARPRATTERRRMDTAATCAPKGALAVQCRMARSAREEGLPGAAPLSVWTKKEERDSGFGARSQTTPIGPLLLGPAVDRARILPIVPGASEWVSLARVRR